MACLLMEVCWCSSFFRLLGTPQAPAGRSRSAQTGSEDGGEGLRPLQRLPRHPVHQAPGQAEGRAHEAGGGGRLLRQLRGSRAHVPGHGPQVPARERPGRPVTVVVVAAEESSLRSPQGPGHRPAHQAGRLVPGAAAAQNCVW